MNALITDLIRQRIAEGHAREADFRGCSDDEIGALESAVGLQLPGLFRDYLRAMGKSAGEMLRGSDVRFGCLHLLTAEGRQAMAADGVALPDDAFAFFAHQGYDYMYFQVSDGLDDPPVYRFHTDWETPRQVFGTFSGYLHWMFGTLMEIPPDGDENGQ